MKRLLPILALACLYPAALPAHADTLLVQRAEAAGRTALPRRGDSMAKVETAFGAPVRKHAPVGGGSARTPAITRWDYPNFSVYFEHAHVVNSVLAKANELELGPAPAGR